MGDSGCLVAELAAKLAGKQAEPRPWLLTSEATFLKAVAYHGTYKRPGRSSPCAAVQAPLADIVHLPVPPSVVPTCTSSKAAPVLSRERCRVTRTWASTRESARVQARSRWATGFRAVNNRTLAGPDNPRHADPALIVSSAAAARLSEAAPGLTLRCGRGPAATLAQGRGPSTPTTTVWLPGYRWPIGLRARQRCLPGSGTYLDSPGFPSPGGTFGGSGPRRAVVGGFE